MNGLESTPPAAPARTTPAATWRGPAKGQAPAPSTTTPIPPLRSTRQLTDPTTAVETNLAPNELSPRLLERTLVELKRSQKAQALATQKRGLRWWFDLADSDAGFEFRALRWVGSILATVATGVLAGFFVHPLSPLALVLPVGATVFLTLRSYKNDDYTETVSRSEANQILPNSGLSDFEHAVLLSGLEKLVAANSGVSFEYSAFDGMSQWIETARSKVQPNDETAAIYTLLQITKDIEEGKIPRASRVEEPLQKLSAFNRKSMSDFLNHKLSVAGVEVQSEVRMLRDLLRRP